MGTFEKGSLNLLEYHQSYPTWIGTFSAISMEKSCISGFKLLRSSRAGQRRLSRYLDLPSTTSITRLETACCKSLAPKDVVYFIITVTDCLSGPNQDSLWISPALVSVYRDGDWNFGLSTGNQPESFTETALGLSEPRALAMTRYNLRTLESLLDGYCRRSDSKKRGGKMGHRDLKWLICLNGILASIRTLLSSSRELSLSFPICLATFNRLRQQVEGPAQS